MAIEVQCDFCFTDYRVKDSLEGKKIKCKECGTSIRVSKNQQADDEFDYEAPVAPRRSSKSSQKSKKSSSSSGLHPTVIIGGCAVLGIAVVGVVVSMFLGRGDGPAGDAPNAMEPAANGAANPLGSEQGQPNAAVPTANGEKELAPSNWNVSADPPKVPINLEINHDVKIDVPKNNGSNKVVYPVTPSTFVAVGSNFYVENVLEVWDMQAGKKVGSVRGVHKPSKGALSPDGKQYVGISKNGKQLLIYDVPNEKEIGKIDLKNSGTAMFAGPNRLVSLSGKTLQIWSMPEGKPEQSIEFANTPLPKSTVISPGGRYMTKISYNREVRDTLLEMYDLNSGEIVGTTSLAKFLPSSYIHCYGGSFSNDGKEFGFTFSTTKSAWLVVWNATNGKVLVEHEHDKNISSDVSSLRINNPGLLFFPNKKRYLVYGALVFDSKNGGPLWTIPVEGFGDNERRLFANNHIVGIAGGGQEMIVRSYHLDEAKLAKTASAVSAGGTSNDAGLPPLTNADASGAKNLAADDATGWNVQPDPIPAVAENVLEKSIPVNTTNGSVDALLPAQSNSGKAVVVYGSNDPKAAQTAIEQFDLTNGKSYGVQKLPIAGQVLGISPDGNQALVRLSSDEERIDVIDTTDGSPVVAFRPYQNEDKNYRKISGATFIDQDHVLTVSSGEKLIVWELPSCRAIYSVKQLKQFGTGVSDLDLSIAVLESMKLAREKSRLAAIMRGKDIATEKDPRQLIQQINREVTTTSPTGRYLTISNGAKIMFFESATGNPQGSLAVNGTLGAACFHPNGEKFAATVNQTGSGMLVVWDLNSGQIESEFPIPTAGNSLQFTGKNSLLLDHTFLIDTTHKTIVWKYIAKNAIHAVHSPDTRHWLIADSGPTSSTKSITALELPEDKAASRIASGKPKPRLYLEPGKTISLQVNFKNNPPDNAQFAQQITERFKSQYEENGIKIDRGQPLTVQLNLEERQTGRKMQFKPLGKSAANAGLQATTVAGTEVGCSIVVLSGRNEVWRTEIAYGNTAFGITRIKPGESVADHLAQKQWAAVTKFFSIFAPPVYVFDAEKSQGLGSSLLTSGGVKTLGQ
ncbi:hypothetical protein [uncultured Gimesia sp.]|uniref:hypothetical protein n=1 Tax=uncultured Gimesia sp. TaxID=1678688 RepID=UPI00260968B5|nr:hypothetical protein [uncultured Gimesia sp.]